MKRHESLAPLSREHHATLILAQLLKKNAPEYKGLPTDIPGKIEYAANMFRNSLEKHFLKEEVMLEKLHHCHPAIVKMAVEIVTEHQQLSKAFLELGQQKDSETAMDALGNALELHIRKEERILFPLIQEHCPDDLLSEIGSLLI